MKDHQHTRGFDRTQAQELLQKGCEDMVNPIQDQHIEQLIEYLHMMAKWNPVYNLTAIKTTDKMVSHHLLDSLVTVPHFERLLSQCKHTTPRIIDVGTGGGLPGVVLAIMHPEWELTLIDPVHKKTAFLTQVKATLNLNNLRIITGKIEDLQETQAFDIITSRAFASLVDFVQWSANALHEKGCYLAMKGQIPHEEIKELKLARPDIDIHQIIPLNIPYLEAERHLLELRPQTKTIHN